MHWTSVLLWVAAAAGAMAPDASALPWERWNERTPQGSMTLCGRQLAEAFVIFCRDEWIPEPDTRQPPTTHTPVHETTTQGNRDQYKQTSSRSEAVPTPTSWKEMDSWDKPSSWEEVDSWDKPSSWEEMDSWDKPSSWEETDSWDKPSSLEKLDSLKKPYSRQKMYRRGRRETVLKERDKRSLVSECCFKPCTIEELRLYC